MTSAPGSSDRLLDHDTVWHYGSPFAEQRSSIEELALVDRGDRSLLTIKGSDRHSWLNILSTQLMSDIADGETRESLILDGNGRIKHQFTVTEIDNTLWLDTSTSDVDNLLAFLQRMIFRSDVSVERAHDYLMLSLLGAAIAFDDEPHDSDNPSTTPASQSLLGSSFLGSTILETSVAHSSSNNQTTSHSTSQMPKAPPIPNLPIPQKIYEAHILPGGGFVRRMPWPNQKTLDLVLPRSSAHGWWTTFVENNARPIGLWAFDALRVAALRPQIGLDTDAKTLPHELRVIGDPAEHGAVHLSKGCYPGQETVAHVHNLGNPPRRLLLVHLAGPTDELPVKGQTVEVGDRVVGHLCTVANHYEQGPIALALIKRTIKAETPLQAGRFSALIDADSVPQEIEDHTGRAAVAEFRRRQKEFRKEES